MTEDYGDAWYDVFADGVICLADAKGIGSFSYIGASHGAGVGWHLTLRYLERVRAFVAQNRDKGNATYSCAIL